MRSRPRRHRRWGPAGPGSRPITATSGAAWGQPSCSPRRRLPAVTPWPRPFQTVRPLPVSLGPPQPVELRRQRPGAVLQVLADRCGCRTAGRGRGTPGQRQSQVCGMHGWVSSGLGQHVHLRPLSIPIRGWMLNSPGGPSSGGPPGVTTLGLLPGSDQLSSTQARPSRSRMARPPNSPAVGAAGQGLGPAGDPKARRPARTGTFSPFCSCV
jgi:hypothetical protein